MRHMPLIVLALSAFGCATAPLPPESIPSEPAPPTSTAAPEAKPALTCAQSVEQGSDQTDELCRPACDSGDASVCFKLGAFHAERTEQEKALPYFEKACFNGSAEACWQGSQLTQTSPDKAAAMQTQGCKLSPASDSTRSCCHANAQVLAKSTRVEDLKAAVDLFDKNCRAGYAKSCSEKHSAKGALDAATKPIEYEGSIVSKTASKIRIKLASPANLAPNASAELLLYFDGKSSNTNPIGLLGGLLGGNVSGWMAIATTTIEKVEGDVVTLVLVKEKSQVTVNGKKSNHFKPGSRIKLAIPKDGK